MADGKSDRRKADSDSQDIIYKPPPPAKKVMQSFEINVARIMRAFISLILFVALLVFSIGFYGIVRNFYHSIKENAEFSLIEYFNPFVEATVLCISLILYAFIFMDFYNLWATSDKDNIKRVIFLVLQSTLLQFLIVVPALERKINSYVAGTEDNNELTKVVLLFIGLVFALFAISYFTIRVISRSGEDSSK